MMNAVIECLMNHRSIRRFQDKPIDPKTLALILGAGIRAPTAGNLQHYSLIVVDDPQKKRAISDNPAVDAATIIIAVVDEYRLKRWFALNDAPFYFDQSVNLLIGFWDAIVALHNVVVAAESLGLGAVYMGRVLSADLHAILDVPEFVFPAGMAWLGYPDESPPLKARLPLEAVVHRNGYQVPTDEKIRRFFQEKDGAWDQLPEEERGQLQARGIRNTAQRVTVGHYTEEFIRGESEAICANLKRAGLRLTTEPALEIAG